MKRVLVYKRTHIGDPNELGEFGCSNCMGRVRSWDFEAVIGVGGIGRDAIEGGVAGMVNWIGITPHKRPVKGKHPIVTFDHSLDLHNEKVDFRQVTPLLAERIYSKNIRATMTFTPAERKEIEKLLKRAESSAASIALGEVTAVAKPKRRNKKVC